MCESHLPEVQVVLLLRDYRITIPSKIQKRLGLKPGDLVFCRLRKATAFEVWRLQQEKKEKERVKRTQDQREVDVHGQAA